MASWAKVASAGIPNDQGRARMKPVATDSAVQQTDLKRARQLRGTVSTVSNFIAVPNIPARRRDAALASLGPSPSTTSAVHSPSQQKSNPSSSSSTPDKGNPIEAPTTPSSVQYVWEYDVYAAPFVLSKWRTINLEVPVRTIPTRSRHKTDYSRYTSTFSGTNFLPKQVTEVAQEEKEITSPADLTASSYRDYFVALLQLECTAKELENEGHALYKVPLYRVEVPNEDPVWALTIPGLREDSPFLEMGDILQLRQLWIDANGSIMNIPMLVEGSEYTHGQSFYYRGWTGIQYDACVSSVNRAKEVLYLKVEDLAPLYAGYNWIPMFVNVTFPLKHTKLHIQKESMSSVASELNKAVAPSTDIGDISDDDEDYHYLNDTAIMKDTPTKASEEEGTGPHNDWLRRMLFPTEEDGIMQTRLRDIPHRLLFDHAINYEQAHAVNSICTKDYGTLPYLISGPPGTGKTKTLVETAMQLYNTSQVRHTLICAPSEAAADTLALRLKHYLNNEQLFRLIRPGRADNEVPGELTQYCYMTNNMFALPPIKTLMAYNIVVTSCQDAGILFEARLTNNDLWHIERNMLATFHPEDHTQIPTLHWGALLIDEAAQATEIDLLPAISVACPPSAYPTPLAQPLFVLAGDENQLGPKTSSRNPQFSISLFARLADRPLYKSHPLSRSSIKPSAAPPVLKKSMLPIIYPPFTNLIRNYRSHPAILSVPSSLFYNDTLIPEAPNPSTPLQHSSLWRSRKWPVLFVPNSQPDEIERDGGGWYNVSEARVACTTAQTLINESEVKQQDICIMSPFAAQVRLLRSMIRSQHYGNGNGLWEVNIGPLEAFQGLEKRVVVICTTRTRERFLGEDEKRGLGIVGQKRKMNVALTRAKEALFVIGNPAILRRDEHWKQWLAFCWRNGLVDDRGEGWDGSKEDFGEERVGVLERALVAKEGSEGEDKKMLGVGARTLDMSRDYELWMESLREALDNEGDDEEEENEDEDADDGPV